MVTQDVVGKQCDVERGYHLSMEIMTFWELDLY